MPSTRWGRTTKRLVIVGLIIVFLLVLYVFRDLLPPIALALVLAYLLKPIVDFVERRIRLSRALATILLFLVILLLIATIPVSVVPYAVDQVRRLNVNLQELTDSLISFLSQPITILDRSFNLQDLVGDLDTAIQDLFQPFATQTVTFLFNVASSLLWIVSILVISFYLVKDADRLRAFLDRIAPPGYTEELGHLREEINHVWKAFFRGQVVLGFAVGLIVWFTMMIVGLPNAGLMGLLAGLLEVVPTFGPILATIPALLIAFFQGSTYLPMSDFWFAVLVLAIYTVIQQTENAYLVPRIMGRRLLLHPVVIFIGVLAGGLLFGALGVLLAAPFIGTLRVLLTYIYAKLLDKDPFPPEFVQAGEIYPGEIDAILFDLDGTMIEIDNEAFEYLTRRLQPLQRFLPKRDAAWVARRILMWAEGPANSLLTFVNRIGLDDTFLDLGDRLRSMQGLHTPSNFRLVDGTGEMLEELSHRYHLGVVTTRCCAHAEAFLEQQELRGLIHVIVGREDTWRIKPHPSPVRHAADELNVPVERCLLVGDTPADIYAARSAGARSAGVLCGLGTETELERAGADLILNTTSDLVSWM
ncbi:MAG: AI-2E family transporter [Anaerolineae bacterium]|jgi:HAD superfamily hydrolase (TIGR01549 family)